MQEKPVELQILETEINDAVRTDYLTLPAPPKMPDPELDKISDMERAYILDPNASDETVIDDKGTALLEWKRRLQLGIMPKDAPKEALQSVGKHTVEIVTNEQGKEEVIITSPAVPTPPPPVAPLLAEKPKLQDFTPKPSVSAPPEMVVEPQNKK